MNKSTKNQDKKLTEFIENFNTPHSQYWPNIKPPLKNESFSSWILRNTLAGLNDIRSLFRLYGIDAEINDFDLDIDADLLSLFASKTGFSKKKLTELGLFDVFSSFRAINDNLHQKNRIGKAIFFTKPLSPQNKNGKNGFRYCPHCLKDDGIPYYRKQWRITINTICEKHACLLSNKCPKCTNSIVYTSFDWDSEINNCPHSNFPLYKVHTNKKINPSLQIEKIRKVLGDSLVITEKSFWIYHVAYFLVKHYNFNDPILEYERFMSNRNELIRNIKGKAINYLIFVDNIKQLHHFLIFATDLFNSHIKEVAFLKLFFEKYYNRREIYKQLKFYNYPIDHCNFKSENIVKLMKHLREHRTFKLQRIQYYRCKECGKSYRYEEELNKHEITHSVKDVYWCEHCSIYWDEKENWEEHMRIHPDPQAHPHTCLLCENEFRNEYRLKVHLNWYHPNHEWEIKRIKGQKQFIQGIVRKMKSDYK